MKTFRFATSFHRLMRRKKRVPPGAWQRAGAPRRKRKQPAATYFPPEWSIIGVRALDFRVRNGNGYNHPTMATGTQNTTQKKREKEGRETGTKIWPGLTAC